MTTCINVLTLNVANSDMKVLLENVKLKKGQKKDGSYYFFVDIQQPVRKFINPESPADISVLEQLVAHSEQKNLILKLGTDGQSLFFSRELVK